MPGPPESEPGTSTSPHASLEFLTEGGGTPREWGIPSPTSSDGRDAALFFRPVATNVGGKAGLEGENGRLQQRLCEEAGFPRGRSSRLLSTGC